MKDESEKISMYEKESIFTETVKIDKLDLSTQFHEGLGKESELYKKYDLRKGFKNFLINDEGVIIAANVTPEKLTEILKAIQSVLFSKEGCSTSRWDSLFLSIHKFSFRDDEIACIVWEGNVRFLFKSVFIINSFWFINPNG